MNCMMMNRKIEILLDETGTAFRMLAEAGGHPNMDYADYVSRTSINRFRSALQNPDLSRVALAAMLRQGFKNKRKSGVKSEHWKSFLAGHIQQTANNNQIAERLVEPVQIFSFHSKLNKE